MKIKLHCLSQKEIIILTNECSPLIFPKDFDLIYQDHTPIAAVAIMQGQLELIRNSKVKHVIESGHLFAAFELIHGIPIPYRCRIKANSKLILLGKSEVVNTVKNSGLSNLISELTASKECPSSHLL